MKRQRSRIALSVAAALVLAAVLPAVAAPPAGPWVIRDIGDPAKKGSVDVDDKGVWTIKGGGEDIWDAADHFFFTYQPLEGDVQITVKALGKPAETNEWAKAGLMIRESLDAGARHALLVVTPANGLAFQWRPTAGAESTWPDASAIDGESLKTPIVLRLTRKGKTITPEYSTDDGKTFQSAGAPFTFNEDLPKSVYIGLAITAHDDTQLSEAKFNAPEVKKL